MTSPIFQITKLSIHDLSLQTVSKLRRIVIAFVSSLRCSELRAFCAIVLTEIKADSLWRHNHMYVCVLLYIYIAVLTE